MKRFWDKVNKAGPIVREGLTPCWVWTACTDQRGYGRINIGQIPVLAHRVAWSLETGEDAAIHVCHVCDNPPCVRFSHLFTGTHADNSRDMALKSRGCRTVPWEQVDEMREKFLAGMSRTDIAQVMGLAQKTVGNYLRGLIGVGRAHIATEVRRAQKLNPTQVREIRASDDPAKLLAARYGVSETFIYHIWSRKAWRSVL